VIDDEHILCEVTLNEPLERLVLERAKHVIVKVNNNGERDEVENDGNRVGSGTNNSDVGEFDAQTLGVLEHAAQECKPERIEFVRVIHCILHHVQPRVYFVHARQVKNSSANEASEHNEDLNLADDDLGVVAVRIELYESHHDQGHLQNERQNHVH